MEWLAIGRADVLGTSVAQVGSRRRGDDHLDRRRDRVVMNIPVVVNDETSVSERRYDAPGFASARSKRDDVEVRVFVIGDRGVDP